MTAAAHLLRDRSGSSGMELALIAPLLCAMLFCGADLANGFTKRLRLEQAADRTAQLAYAPGTALADYSFLQAEGATASGQAAGNVTVDNWLECDGVRSVGTVTSPCVDGQQRARYVSVSIVGTYQPFFRWAGLIVGTSGTNGSVVLSGDATVRLQ